MSARTRLPSVRSKVLRVRFRRPVSLVACVFSLAAPAQAAGTSEDQLSNQLTNHPSPYLALHAADPVAWQDWNEEALARARREGKPLYLSIGYFSCHWCHVMQRESYRNAAIARVLNRHFIPVKVDRELEPALDARMIRFVEDTRGIAGWPLNVFLTPQGQPLFATLYEPPAEFLALLEKLAKLWRQDAAGLTRLAARAAPQAVGPGAPHIASARVQAYRQKFVTQALAQADTFQGGFGEQGKFPNVPQLSLLLDEFARTRTAAAGEFLQTTLDHMATRGLRDHLGGGFFRYTIDPAWTQPHFEKMLYDNALLAELYLRAAAVFNAPNYRAVALDTLDFVLREMRAQDGGFIASLSALDAAGEEGGYYLWSQAELTRRLTDDEWAVYRRAAGMQDAPTFAGGYLPMRAAALDELAAELKRPPAAVQALVAAAEAKLRTAREARRLPRDTKRLAAWNGLLLRALVAAARTTGEARYRDAARDLKTLLATGFWDGRRLRRSLVDGASGAGAAALEDYAYVASGLLAWAEYQGTPADFASARAVALAGWRGFYARGWRLAAGGPLTAEPVQDVIADGPMPAPPAVLLATSLRLARVLQDGDLRLRALAALNTGDREIGADPFWYPSQIRALAAAAAR